MRTYNAVEPTDPFSRLCIDFMPRWSQAFDRYFNNILFTCLDNGEDNEDKNLSWLFNFKLDDIANLSPEIKRKRTNNNNNNSSHNHHHQNNHQSHTENQQSLNFFNSHNNSINSQTHFEEQQNQPRLSKDPCIEDDLNVAENIVISNTPSSTTTHT